MNEVYGLDEEELRQLTQKIQSVTLPRSIGQKELLHPDNLLL